jgi:Glycosyl hydrolases family 11
MPPFELNCDAAMPTSGGEQHSGNGVGGDGNLAWDIWSNTGEGELTTYDVPAFSASWDEAGGYLGRLGFEWGGFGETPGPYETHGVITAYYAANKTGTAGTYSYVGMYGWSTEPCVEWYVVDDSYNTMPINPGNTTKMAEVDIDEGTYIMYTRPTTGSGGTRCDGVNEWIQYYSVRTTSRRCGQISLTEHFDAWKGLGMPLGNLLEAKILVEVGGGTGRVDFPVANVTTTQ